MKVSNLRRTGVNQMAVEIGGFRWNITSENEIPSHVAMRSIPALLDDAETIDEARRSLADSYGLEMRVHRAAS